jgi:hypothetical protein
MSSDYFLPTFWQIWTQGGHEVFLGLADILDEILIVVCTKARLCSGLFVMIRHVFTLRSFPIVVFVKSALAVLWSAKV